MNDPASAGSGNPRTGSRRPCAAMPASATVRWQAGGRIIRDKKSRGRCTGQPPEAPKGACADQAARGIAEGHGQAGGRRTGPCPPSSAAPND